MEGIIEPAGDPPAYTGTEILSTVSSDIQNLTLATTTFTYYDRNGALITDYTKIGDVRFVTAMVVVDTNPNNQPTQLTLRSSTALRNLLNH